MPGIREGKVALVSGAGHGIGRGHALELAKQGAKVVVNDQNPEPRFDRFGPNVSSPVVAWLASEEAGFVFGQAVKAVFDRIQWMEGRTPRKIIATENKPWIAQELGKLLMGQVFGVRAPGLTIGE